MTPRPRRSEGSEEMTNLEVLEKIAQEATQENWGPYRANLPFYAEVNKPAPSFSKHDSERPTYWKIEDAVFLATFNPKQVLEMIKKIKRQEKELDELAKCIYDMDRSED